jgi:WD40 repeat protein
VKIWSRAGQLLNSLIGHRDGVCNVSFSPDGQLIASGGGEGMVKLWNRRGTLIQTLKGHTDSVLSVSFSPNSQRLASTSRDGTVKLWSRDGSLIKTLREPGDREAGLSGGIALPTLPNLVRNTRRPFPSMLSPLALMVNCLPGLVMTRR